MSLLSLINLSLCLSFIILATNVLTFSQRTIQIWAYFPYCFSTICFISIFIILLILLALHLVCSFYNLIIGY